MDDIEEMYIVEFPISRDPPEGGTLRARFDALVEAAGVSNF